MTDTEERIQEALRVFEAKATSDQLKVLAERVGQLAEGIIIQSERDRRLDEKVNELKSEVALMHKDISEIREYANKWRGGFYAIAAMGAILGAIIAFWDKVRTIWGH